MGNCQAADSSMVVIQHPQGRVERLYWPVTAREVMRSNPGYYVALVTLCQSQGENEERREKNGVRFTRVRLLRPKDTLMLGNVYRLVTSQEIMKGLWAKKHGRAAKSQPEPRLGRGDNIGRSERQTRGLDVPDQTSKDQKEEGHGGKITTQPVGRSSSRHWRPSLHSISEVNRLPQSDTDSVS